MKSGWKLDGKFAIILVVTVLVVVVAGLAFVYKMVEFAMTIVHDDVSGFGPAAVATYLLGMLPLLFLTLWAALSGRLRDIEAPKYRMLELNEDIGHE